MTRKPTYLHGANAPNKTIGSFFRFPITLLSGYFVISLCVVVLIGWQIDNPLLRSLIPGQPQTTPLTAIMLLFLAASLIMSKMALSNFLPISTNMCKWVKSALAGTVAVLAIWTIFQYLLSLPPSIELLLYRNPVLENGGDYPGRPSPHTAIASLLLGISIWFSSISGRRVHLIVVGAAMAGFVIPWFAFFGYVTLSNPFYSVAGSPETGMSLITALCYLALFVGTIWLRPDTGLVRLLRARSSGGVIVRVMLPVAVAVPLVLAWLALYQSEYLDLFNNSVLVGLNWGITSILLAGLITLGGFILNKRDSQVAEKQKEVDSFFSISLDLLCMVGFDGYLKRANPAFQECLGFSIDELYSKPLLDFVHSEDIDPTRDNLYIPQDTGETIEFESRFVCKDGSTKWLAWTASPLKERRLIYAVARDVTARKEYQASVEQYAEELEVLASIGETINSSPDIKEIYQEFAELVSRVLPYDRLSINIIDWESNSYTPVYSIGHTVPNRNATNKVPLRGTLVEELANTNQLLLLNESEISDRLPGFQWSGLETILIIPLLSNKGILGALSLRSAPKDAYSPNDVRFAKRVADQISGAIANSQLRADLEQQSRERDVISYIGRIITSSLDISDLYEPIAEQIRTLISFDRLSIATYDDELGLIRHTYVEGVDVPGYGMGHVIEEHDSASATVLSEGQSSISTFNAAQDIGDMKAGDRAAFEAGLYSAIKVPMVSNGKIIAGLKIRSKKCNAYSQRDLDLMERIGRQMARSISNSILHNQVQRDAEERSVIAEIGKIINSSLDLNEVFSGFADLVKPLIPFDRLTLALVDQSAGTFKTVWSQGVSVQGRDSDTVVPLAGTVVGEIVESSRALIVDEDSKDMLLKYPNFVSARFRTTMGISLTSGEKTLGVLTMRSRIANIYTNHHVKLIERIGEQITGAVINSQLYEAQLKSEEALIESERRYRNIIELAGDVMFTTDPQGFFNFTNEPAEKLTGYSRNELAGKHYLELVHPDWKSKVARFFKHQLAEIIPEKNLEFPIITKSGATRWVDQTVTLQKNDGEIEGFQAVLRDVTDRREAQEDFKKLSRQKDLILQSAGEGIYGVDLEGHVTFVNSAAAKMIGWEPQELIGQVQHEVLHHTTADGIPYPVGECPIYSALADGEVHNVTDEVFWRKDGTSFPVEYISTPIIDGGQSVGAVVTFQDISERLEVNRMKDEFVSMVSHELRTPLTSIKGSLGLIAGGAAGELPNKARRMIEIASTNTDRLVRLINDILDIERIESGKISMEKVLCDAGELVEQAINAVNGVAENTGISLQTEPYSAKVFADPDRIIQTLTNLIGNAIKFSPENGTVKLKIERQEEFVIFKVIDEGRGIPDDKLESIFGRFQQVDASDSREKGGSGLGLSISKSIVEMHGGRIWVESVYGEGTTFYFAIPGAQNIDDRDSTFESITAKVLFCDDDGDTLEVVGEFLDRHGYKMIPAHSSEEALDLAAEINPDVILLDIMMPEMNGWEILANIKSNPDTKDIPVVMLTNVPPENGTLSMEGVAGWVTKLNLDPQLANVLNNARNGGNNFRQILLVEDDLDLADTLVLQLSGPDVKVFAAPTAKRAIELCRSISPDLLILDLALPDANGYSLLKWVRRQKLLKNMPVVVYSASDLNNEEANNFRMADARVFIKSRVAPEDFSDHVLSLLDEMVGEVRETEMVHDR